ncbi:MAG: methyltransferase domain-containing protein [Cyanobacteriota bacterium]
MTLSPPSEPVSFSQRVRQAFGRHVAAYEPQARLQRGIAWRLASWAQNHGWGHSSRRRQPLPQGPGADLGAGTGLVGRALEAWRIPLPAPLQQLDLCPEALARNSSGPTFPWDLNQGLPPQLQGAALLTSSFALQWLDTPTEALTRWGELLAPGGWLLLAVPTAGSFPQWRQAAQRAGVPCSALTLPRAEALLHAGARGGLEIVRSQVLTFSPQRPASNTPAPLAALRALQAIGAGTSRQPAPLTPGAWRRLLAAWPQGGQLSWEVLLLLAQKRQGWAPTPGAPPCNW